MHLFYLEKFVKKKCYLDHSRRCTTPTKTIPTVSDVETELNP